LKRTGIKFRRQLVPTLHRYALELGVEFGSGFNFFWTPEE